MTARIGNRNGPPGGSTALQRGDPELVRLEVDVAGPDRERLAHPAPGQREGLDRGLRVRVRAAARNRLALGRGQVLSARARRPGRRRSSVMRPEKLHYFME